MLYRLTVQIRKLLFLEAPTASKITRYPPTMALPPPSPDLDKDAITDLQTGAPDSPTPSLHADDVALATALFGATNKRHSSDGRDGSVSGANSPMKKKINFQPSPARRVTLDADEAVPLPHLSLPMLMTTSIVPGFCHPISG